MGFRNHFTLGNAALVGGIHMCLMTAATLKIRGGCSVDSKGNKAGKCALIQWEKSATLGVSQDQTLFVWKGTDTVNRTEATDTE